MDGVIVDFVSALEAVRKLNEKYDCYILSTAPWRNPSAWSDKVEFEGELILFRSERFPNWDSVVEYLMEK